MQGRNLPFDALAAVCNIDTRNQTQVKRMTFALKRIRAYFYEEVEALGIPEGLTPEDWEYSLARAIEVRAEKYRIRFRNAELTPTALEAWWHQMAQARTAGPQSDPQLQAIIDEMHQLHGKR